MITRHHEAGAPSSSSGRPRSTGWTSLARQLEQELDRERRRYAELAEARRQEGDARNVRKIALDAFNRSEHVERIVSISRSLGDPIVNVTVDGCDLPRRVRLIVAWDISWYEYVVRLDLHERTVSVDEEHRGDDPRDLPVWRLTPTRCCVPTGSC